MNQKEPLGLPSGSVRALLVIVLVVSSVLLYALHGDIPPLIERMTELSLGWYFLVRTAQKKE